jgi:hypothetical protein
MNPYELMKVYYFLLADIWKEDGVEFGRISYVLTSNNSYEEHLEYVKEAKQKLLSDHDEEYIQWVFTAEKYRCLNGAIGHATVMHFRIRDSY